MVKLTSHNKRVPPALTAFAPGNTARSAGRVGTLERYMKSADRLGFGAPDNRKKRYSRLSHPVRVHASVRDARSLFEETKKSRR